MIKEDVSELSFGSHREVTIICDLQISSKCKKEFKAIYKDVYLRRQRNNIDKDYCLYCHHSYFYLGRTNPNTKHHFINDNFFKDIDTEGKAYLLGWLASDGHFRQSGICISIHKKDEDLFSSMSKILGGACIPKIPIHNKVMRYFNINSTTMSADGCRWLNIGFGRKSDAVQFPETIPEEFKWAFVRGYFEGDGTIRNPVADMREKGFTTPEVSITSNSSKMLESLSKFSQIPNRIEHNSITWSGNNAIDFLGKIYNNSVYKLNRKYELYCQISQYVPGISGSGSSAKFSTFKCVKTRKDAILPNKQYASDSGYDITILEKVKTHGDVEFYDTGIKIRPSYGWWLMLVPRSSISKSGYMLTNSVGIIDRTYTGNILVSLRKIDKNAPDLQLPCRIGQLIPMPAVHFEIEEVDDLIETARSDKGFGSTGA